MQNTQRKSSFSEKSQTPRKQKNEVRRSREFLTEQEVEKLRSSARSIGRHGQRDATLILIAFRHALRVSELVSLRWDQIDLQQGLIHVRRAKNGINGTHPLRGVELRELRRLQRDYPDTQYVFVTERKTPLSARAVNIILSRAASLAGLGELSIHAHMLRHSAGFYLVNKGHDTRSIQAYFGHKNINNTVIYTQLSHTRFKDFWTD